MDGVVKHLPSRDNLRLQHPRWERTPSSLRLRGVTLWKLAHLTPHPPGDMSPGTVPPLQAVLPSLHSGFTLIK